MKVVAIISFAINSPDECVQLVDNLIREEVEREKEVLAEAERLIIEEAK